MEKPEILYNCRLFDGDVWHGDELFAISIENGRIKSVDRTAGNPAPQGASDLGGSVVIPGLIDAHFHCNSPSLNVGAMDSMAPSHLGQYARKFLTQALDAGFTTVRDAAGADAGLVAAIEEGLIDGPRLFVAGKALSQTGGHGDFGTAYPICECSPYSGYLSQVVDGADSVRRVVRTHLRDGAHHIKIFVSGGVLSPADPIWMEQFTDEEIIAAVQEAGRRRTYVMAHALTARSIQRCSRLGVRSIEHGLQIDAETAAMVAQSESYVVPTLTVYDALVRPEVNLPEWAVEKAHKVRDDASRSVAECVKAGVRLGLGTDLLGMLHGRESHEFILRSAIHGSLETLRSATSINARIMMRDDEFGSVRAGLRADMLILDGDPIADITILTPEAQAIRAVLKAGKVVRGQLAGKPALAA